MGVRVPLLGRAIVATRWGSSAATSQRISQPGSWLLFMLLTSTPAETLLRKQKAIKRELLMRVPLLDVRVAVLGASTTQEVVDLLELALLERGLKPAFYQSEYNRFYEDAVLDTDQLIAFNPNFVYLHTSSQCCRFVPNPSASEADFEASLARELARFEEVWDALAKNVDAVTIQNNFEPPSLRVFGNLDASIAGGRVRYHQALNTALAQQAAKRSRFLLNDLASLACQVGLEGFLDARRWYSYKIPTTPRGSLEIARSVASIIAASYGRTRKCLVLDLDNTLWGGVIGDDGVDKIKLGRETAQAEAYTAFQEYCLSLRHRGILLAVCSKNDEAVALQGLEHPDAVLRREHFSAFVANWEPKHQNIEAIAQQLNIGLDSLVFVDDNPAERAIVTAQLPMVAVPEVGDDVTQFASIIEREAYFETVGVSREDLARSDLYAANAARDAQERRFANYGEYLDSLQMKAEIARFAPTYYERITQLINKTNQYNLTTKRYSEADVLRVAASSEWIPLYGRLLDAFGDNGLVTIVMGRQSKDAELHIDTWLMSCRVLKRDMELAMLDVLVAEARRVGMKALVGYYVRSAKNGMVADHYERLGFACSHADESQSTWKLDISSRYETRNRHIREIFNG